MTERLYYKDQYIKEFEAAVVSCTEGKNGFEVILDKTAFFPEGGGQPGDRGFIGEAKVLDTVEKGDEVIHICDAAVSGNKGRRLGHKVEKEFDRNIVVNTYIQKINEL